VTDANGNTATVSYQVGTLLGTAESVVKISGDTVDAGTTVSVSIDGNVIGSVLLDSSGAGTLIVPTSSLATAPAAGSAVLVGNFSGTFATSSSSSSSSNSTTLSSSYRLLRR
jgi:hypothetical protein